MKTLLKRPSAIGTCAAMLAGVLMVASLPAQAAKRVPAPQPTLSTEQAIDHDAAAIASMEGISAAQAEAVIIRQAAIGEIIPTIESILGSTNAGVSVDVPELSTTLNVRVTGKLRKATATKLDEVQRALRRAGVTIEVIEGVDHSVAELTAAVEGFPADSSEIVGIGVDLANNELVVDVTRSGAAAEAASEGGAVAATSTSRKPAATEPVWSGITVSERLVPPSGDQMYGGTPMSTCTTGFSVKNSAGATGYLTAGHCGNSQSYSITSPFTTFYSSTFMAERYNATTDMQWHKVNSSAGAAVGYFYGQSGSSVTKRTGTATPYGGLYLCHRGRTTGHSCGNVGTTTYKPAYDNACNGVACSAVFTNVIASTLTQAPGDSGGPWFMGGTAYGIHKGGSKLSPGTVGFFTPISRISGFSGLSLL